MSEVLNNARAELELCRMAFGKDTNGWTRASRALAALVAEIEAAPVVDVFKFRGCVVIEPDDESLVGKRVRLLAEGESDG